jgi:LPXTG-motif cell wall-anchored protein
MKKQQFWLLGLGAAVLAAATYLFTRKKSGDVKEKPPRNAPQLKLEHPGDQSEFTTAPSDSELG